MLRNSLEATRFKRTDSGYHELTSLLGHDLGDSISLSQLSHYPDVSSEIIYKLLPGDLRADFILADLDTVLADILYKGYIQSSRQNFERIHQHDHLEIPQNLKFGLINGLSNEMVERLERSKPQTFGQARHLSGMTPAALFLLLHQLKRLKAA
jgi:tRNA uridine 5-carboxymethylaminomethyl modification enzyme